MADQATVYLLDVDGYELAVFHHGENWLGVCRSKESNLAPPPQITGKDLESTKLELCLIGYRQAGKDGPGAYDACREAKWEEIPFSDWISRVT